MFQLLVFWADVFLVTSLALLSGIGNNKCGLNDVHTYVNETYSIKGMEAFPFKIGDYNRDVQENYPGEKGLGMTLHYADDNTIAFIIIYDNKDFDNTTEAVSEQLFESIKQHYVGTCFSERSLRYIDSYAMKTTSEGLGLPVVHVQTAGHAAGGAFHHQRQQVNNEPATWVGKTIYAVSAHKDFGSDTRFAAVIVFEELSDPDFTAPAPYTDVTTDEQRIRLLDDANAAFGRR